MAEFLPCSSPGAFLGPGHLSTESRLGPTFRRREERVLEQRSREGRQGIGPMSAEALARSLPPRGPEWTWHRGAGGRGREKACASPEQAEGTPSHLHGRACEAAGGARLQCGHSACPAPVAVLMDQVLGRPLGIHPPVLRSQVLAGHRQETRKSQKGLSLGVCVNWRGAGGGEEGVGGKKLAWPVGLPWAVGPPSYAAAPLQYKSTPGKKVSIVGWMVRLPDDPEHPDIFQLNNPEKGGQQA